MTFDSILPAGAVPDPADQLQTLLTYFGSAGSVRRSGEDWMVRCPAHDDSTPSLAITERDGRILWHCHAGCSQAAVRHALPPGLLPATTATQVETDVYDYTDEGGQLLFQVIRLWPKKFRPRRPDGAGGWVWKLNDTRRVLYRLPQVLAADADTPVWIVEGEKDVHALEQVDATATCNPGGAGQWRPEYNEALRGREVRIVADRDEPGRAHARQVAHALEGAAARVRVYEAAIGKDVSDHLDAGLGLGELVEADVGPDGGAVPRERAWPQLHPDALDGLAGEIVRLVQPHTEADPVAILVTLLVLIGNAIGRAACWTAGADRHHANLFAVIVGDTATARKGSSFAMARSVVQGAFGDWAQERIQSGASSGEGLIHAVRDPVMRREPIREKKRVVRYEQVEADAGVLDKRLLDYEPEFASVLRRASRDGNTLSTELRQAWDGGTLGTLTKHNPSRATGAHVSLVGHCTTQELRRELTRTDAASGFGNRILWVVARRSQLLPSGGAFYRVDLTGITRKLVRVREHAQTVGRLDRDHDAEQLWESVYADLTQGAPGLLGAITARADAQAMRIAMIYALLDLSPVIRARHLRAGLAVWDYCRQSSEYIFGDSLGDPVADDILAALRQTGPAGLTRTEIRNLFAGHRDAHRITAALRELHTQGLAEPVPTASTGGRPAERWRAKRARPQNTDAFHASRAFRATTTDDAQAASRAFRAAAAHEQELLDELLQRVEAPTLREVRELANQKNYPALPSVSVQAGAAEYQNLLSTSRPNIDAIWKALQAAEPEVLF